MNLINNNPYRVLGLLAGATAKEQNRQTSRLKKFIEAEQELPTDDFSFPVIGDLTRTIESIEDAASKLNLDKDKIFAALFWFWNGNPITDEVAFEALKEGNIDEAYEIWDKLITETKEDGSRYWKIVTEKNASAFHNCFVVNISKTNGNIHNAIAGNLYFLESEFSQKFVSNIADNTYKTNSKELQINFLNNVIQEIEKRSINLTLDKFVSIINAVTFSAKADFLKSISQKITSNISAKIETTRKKCTANKANTAKAGEELYQQTKNDLEQLKTVVGAQDFAYSNIADKVANEILQCSIEFFNHSQDINANNDYANIAVKLGKLAENIVIGSVVKDRIKENVTTMERMKDREILDAIEVLKIIKKTHDDVRYDYQRVVNTGQVNIMLRQVFTAENLSRIETCKNTILLEKYLSLLDSIIKESGDYYWLKSHFSRMVNLLPVGSTLKTKYLFGNLNTPIIPPTSSSSTSTYSPTTSSKSTKSSGGDDWIFWLFGILTVLGIIIGAANDGHWIIGGIIGFIVASFLVGLFSD